ncbi:hypothetical protein KUTeg_023037 [Tegillarca granosa]|uniref:Uncharacterized protein n=1 Tax=Tegillarca granosa TaxID=220873 RepID=A0ABQ9E611_TEGGR|nr:hypothetical protein KUTeg_023037 [Tegillarca granosa]
MEYKNSFHDDKKMGLEYWYGILTGPQYLDSRTVHVKQTLGRLCNVLLFFSPVENKTFPTIGVNTTEGRQHLTDKSVAWNIYLQKPL